MFTHLKEQHSALNATLTEKVYGCLASYPDKKIEIHWLNKDNERGEGCDFLIIEKGETLQYIEVKATEGEDEQLLEVTGLQWRVAYNLYEKGNGNRYMIFRVLNAGKKNAKIKPIINPVKLWNEGKLYAHPVNLKL